jgi:hypothetical protein
MRLTIAVGYTDQYSSIGSSMIVAGPRVMINAAGDKTSDPAVQGGELVLGPYEILNLDRTTIA